MFYKICMTGSMICFVGAASMLMAYVYDVDPISPDKEYMLEKQAFDRHNECWAKEFPSFVEWCEGRLNADSRLRDWLGQVGADFANEFAASCEMNVQQLKDWCHARGTTIGEYQSSAGDYGGLAPDPYDTDSRGD